MCINAFQMCITSNNPTLHSVVVMVVGCGCFSQNTMQPGTVSVIKLLCRRCCTSSGAEDDEVYSLVRDNRAIVDSLLALVANSKNK